MQKYISVNELYSKLCGRLSTLQLEKIKSIIAECDTITVFLTREDAEKKLEELKNEHI